MTLSLQTSEFISFFITNVLSKSSRRGEVSEINIEATSSYPLNRVFAYKNSIVGVRLREIIVTSDKEQ